LLLALRSSLSTYRSSPFALRSSLITNHISPERREAKQPGSASRADTGSHRTWPGAARLFR
jgi:hypothetical protein